MENCRAAAASGTPAAAQIASMRLTAASSAGEAGVVGVRGPAGASRGQDPASERRRVHDRHALLDGVVEQPVGRPIQECPAVVRDEDLENVGIQVAAHQLHRAARQAQMLGETFVAQLDQLVHGAARGREVVE